MQSRVGWKASRAENSRDGRAVRGMFTHRRICEPAVPPLRSSGGEAAATESETAFRGAEGCPGSSVEARRGGYRRDGDHHE